MRVARLTPRNEALEVPRSTRQPALSAHAALAALAAFPAPREEHADIPVGGDGGGEESGGGRGGGKDGL